jgi:tetratricopeptide (TPR) repeat protein
MRIPRWFLIPLIVFLFCLAFFLSSLAQEKLSAIVKNIEPSTVVILTYDKEGEILGQGSGFFISQNGDIITNWHVLQGASRAEVKTAQGKVYPINKIVAEDKEADIIRVSVDVPLKAIYPLSISDSIPEVGEPVVVIGSPLGLEQTVTNGIVSAVRDIPEFGKIIQITAPLSPGSSGSPVVNMKGEVIGVATFQMVEGQNLNFAIPGERVRKLTPLKGKTLAQWETSRAEEGLGSADSLYSTGLVLLWTEDYEKALPYFKEAVKKNPRWADAYILIGYCNGQLGRYTEAIEAEKEAIRIGPDYALAHYNLGVTYYQLGRYTEAISAYKQAIRIKPDLAEAHYNLGVAYYKIGRYTEAISTYKQAIRIKPDDAEAHCGLGSAYGKLGRYTEEVEACKVAIRIKPDYADAHCNLGSAYGKLGRYAESVEACKVAIRIKPDYAEAHCNLGVSYTLLGRYTEAIEALKEAIRIKPDYANAHFGLGFIYLILEDRGSALDQYKILKNLDKDLANQLFNLIYK